MAVGITDEDRAYSADIRAHLKKFVIGEDFDNDDLFKVLKGGDASLWSMRIVFHPQARLIGGFLRPGEFIGLAFRARAVLATEGFVPVITRARNVWTSIFPAFPRLTDNRERLLSDFRL